MCIEKRVENKTKWTCLVIRLFCFYYRRTLRQNTSPSPEEQFTPTSTNQIASLDLHQPSSTNKNNGVADSVFTPNSSTTSKPGAGNSNSLPGHQSGRSKQNNPRLIDQQGLNLSDSVNIYSIKFLELFFLL